VTFVFCIFSTLWWVLKKKMAKMAAP